MIIPAVSGVYKITQLSTGRCYIGSSKNVQKRIHWHKHRLNKGNHHSYFLQRAWNKSKPEDFEFTLLKQYPLEDLMRAELWWIRRHKAMSPVGFNLCPSTDSKRGYKHNKKTIAKMRASAIIVGSSPEERQRRSERAKLQHQLGKFGRQTWKRK